MSYYRDQLEAYLSKLEVHVDSILDLGGLQLPVVSRLKSCGYNDYIIADIEDKADVKVDISALAPFEKVFTFRKEKFDVVFCLEVFEYVVNPLNAVMNIADYLKSGGVAYITFPFVYPIHKPEGTDMLRYTENWIRKVMEHYGFKYLDIMTRVDRSGLLTNFYADDGMKAQKGLNHNVTGYIVKGVKE